MCLFSLLFVAMGGEFWRRWCICVSEGELWAQKFSLRLCRRLHRGSSHLSFFFFPENCPGAGCWRWKMSRVTTFDRFILQRWRTYITVTTINDILPCKLEMHHYHFITTKNNTVSLMYFISWDQVLLWYLSVLLNSVVLPRVKSTLEIEPLFDAFCYHPCVCAFQ